MGVLGQTRLLLPALFTATFPNVPLLVCLSFPPGHCQSSAPRWAGVPRPPCSPPWPPGTARTQKPPPGRRIPAGNGEMQLDVRAQRSSSRWGLLVPRYLDYLLTPSLLELQWAVKHRPEEWPLSLSGSTWLGSRLCCSFRALTSARAWENHQFPLPPLPELHLAPPVATVLQTQTRE